MNRPDPQALVLDSTALLALGASNRWLSGLISKRTKQEALHLFAPALCLTAAVAQRPLLADHIGGLDDIDILDLTYSAPASSEPSSQTEPIGATRRLSRPPGQPWNGPTVARSSPPHPRRTPLTRA